MFKTIILIIDTDLTQKQFDSLLPFTSEEKQGRIKQFRFFSDAQNCLLGDMLTRVEICRATGLRSEQLEFSVNEYGKPYLENEPDIHFNISHCKRHVALAVDSELVGIDIELIRPINLKIAERFFAADETDYIMSAEQDLQFQRFFEVWTKKESRIKWEGRGLRKPLPSFSVFEPGRLAYHKVHHAAAVCHVCSAKRQSVPGEVINMSILYENLRFLGYTYSKSF